MDSTTRGQSEPATHPLSHQDYVVLGMVGLGARSGYEIKQMVMQSIRFFWTISQVQIYPSLARLEEAGLLTGSEDPDDKRRRRAFDLTTAGRRELRDWMVRHEPMPFELRDVAMVKLFFADALDPADAKNLLAAVRQRSCERIDALRMIEPSAAEMAAGGGPNHPQLTLRMGIAFHQAMIDVCSQFERAVEEAKCTTSSGAGSRRR
jgi:DNA-binding PadR family transcriptional regulator